MIHYSCIGATGYVCGEVLRMMVNLSLIHI